MERKEKRAARMPLDDEAIIDLYWARDEKAIEETDRKYKPYLYTVVYRVLHDEQDTAECINDTYLGAWNAIPPARPRAFNAFLTTIAHRIAIKRYHHTRRGRMVPSEMTVSLSELEDFIAEEGDPTQDFDSARLGRVISLFVRSLSERRRFIFMSRYYMSEPIDEIARDLSVSRSTVNKELAAIRAALKEKLENEGYLI